MDKKSALRVARDYVGCLVADKYKVKNAFLFGSYANNRQREDSDIDIALVLDDYDDTIEEFSRLMRLRRKIDLRIEPHPISALNFRRNNPFVAGVKKGLKIV